MDTQEAHTKEGNSIFGFFFLHAPKPQPKKKKRNAPQPTPNNTHAHSAPLPVLFVVVLCGSVESVLLSELFKHFFHRCLCDFLGQLPLEWEITENASPSRPTRYGGLHTERTL